MLSGGTPVTPDQFLLNLKLTPCPHCKTVGSINRHGFLKGFQGQDVRGKSIRAHRAFCSNRGRSQGCGRTFSVWIADKVKRLFLSAAQLWRFLKESANTGNKRKAFKSLACDMSDSAPYRIWKRFQNAQAAIRTALSGICPSPECERSEPASNQNQNQNQNQPASRQHAGSSRPSFQRKRTHRATQPNRRLSGRFADLLHLMFLCRSTCGICTPKT